MSNPIVQNKPLMLRIDFDFQRTIINGTDKQKSTFLHLKICFPLKKLLMFISPNRIKLQDFLKQRKIR